MSKVLSFRVSDEEAAWADGYVKERESSRQAFLLAAFQNYRRDCEGGVPDVPDPQTPAEYAAALVCHQPGQRMPKAPPSVMGDRQARLNAMIDRARGSKR